MNPDDTPASRQARLREALDEYLLAVGSGKPVSGEEFIAQHPDLQQELQAFLTAQETLLPGELPPNEQTTAYVPAGAKSVLPSEDFGDYELLEEIGRGGMGVVYKARQKSLDRLVALKMILTGSWASEDEMRRFRAEAQAAAHLSHPGVVPIYEIGEFAGRQFFAMAFIEGHSLAQKLSEGPLAPREAAEMIRRLAEAVAHAHGQGIIHRDLKPSNVLIDREGAPHVTDFGLAKRVQGDSGLTASGQILGTPSYMPPEQAAGRIRDVGVPSDVYALGAVLYALLTGRPPFQADNPVDTIMQVLTQEPAAPRRLNPAIPQDLETICLKCLEKEQSKRYPVAQDLIDDLRRFSDNLPVRARPLGLWGRAWRWSRRNPAKALALGAVSTAALTVAMVSTIAYFRVNRALDSAEHRLRVSEARRLAASSLACLEESPSRSLLLALEAIRITADHNEPRVPAAEQALRTALSRAGGVPLGNKLTLTGDGRWLIAEAPAKGRAWLCDLSATQPFERPIEFAAQGPFAVSADQRWLASSTPEQSQLLLWDLAAIMAGDAKPRAALTGAEMFRTLEFAGRWLIADTSDRTRHFWDASAPDPSATHCVFRPHRPPLIGGGGRWLLTQSCELIRPARAPVANAADLVLWDLHVSDFTAAPLVVRAAGSRPAELTLLPGGRWCLCHELGSMQLLDLLTADPSAQSVLLGDCGQRQTFAAASADGHWLFAVGNEGQVFRWDLSSASPADSRQTVVRESTSSMRVCPRGRYLWVSAENGERSLRDVWSPDEKPRPVLLPGYPAAFSPDGRWIVFKSEREGAPGASYHLCDCRNNQAPNPTLLHESVVQQIETLFSTDGRWLVTGNGRLGGRLWDLSGAIPASNPLEPRPTNDGRLHVLFSPDGRRLVWHGSEDPVSKLIDLSLPDAVTKTVELRGHEQGAQPLFFSGNGRWLFTQRPFNDTRVWDVTRQNLVTEPCVLRGHSKAVRALAVSPDSRWLATGSDDRTMCFWDLAAVFPDEHSIVLGPHDSEVRTIQFSPRGDWVLTLGRHDSPRPHVARLWKVGQRGAAPEPRLIDKHQGELVVFVFSPDGRWLASAGRDLQARIWDMNADPPSVVMTLPHRLATTRALAFTRDAQTLVAADADGLVRLWSLGGGGPGDQPVMLRLDDSSAGIASSAAVSLSDNGRWLAVTSNTGDAVHVWDFQNLESAPARFTGHNLPVSSVTFSPGSRWLATRGEDLALRLHDLTASNPAAIPIVFWRVHDAIHFSQDGHWLLTAGNNSLWNLNCRNPAAEAIRLRHEAPSPQLSPDRRWAAASKENQVVLWDLTADPPGEEALVLDGHRGSVSDRLMFSPDSRWLITAGNDHEVRLWNLRVEELIALAKRTAGRELYGHERDHLHLASTLRGDK